MDSPRKGAVESCVVCSAARRHAYRGSHECIHQLHRWGPVQADARAWQHCIRRKDSSFIHYCNAHRDAGRNCSWLLIESIKTGKHMFTVRNSRIIYIFAALCLCVIPYVQAQDGSHELKDSQLRGKKILMIAGEAEKDHPNDDLLIKKHLEQQGYVVTMGAEDDEASKVAGQD